MVPVMCLLFLVKYMKNLLGSSYTVLYLKLSSYLEWLKNCFMFNLVVFFWGEGYICGIKPTPQQRQCHILNLLCHKGILTYVHFKRNNVGTPWWLSGLRIWHCRLLWLGSLLCPEFNLWPGNFCMLWVWQKKERM